MLYCNVIDGQVKTSAMGLLAELVGKTEQEINELGWYRVVFNNMPHHLDGTFNMLTQYIEMRAELVGNVVECTHVVVDKSPELIQQTEISLMEVLRMDRNMRLTQCDWTQLIDAPLTVEKKVEWASYRQALRDLPSGVELNNVIWPTPPI